MNSEAGIDLYARKAPRDIDAAQAAAQVASWEAAGSIPAASPFEVHADIGWPTTCVEKLAVGCKSPARQAR